MSRRLESLLIARGFGPRSDAQRAIRRGLVQIDGEVVRDPKLRVDDDLTFVIDGETCEPPPVLVAWHKPVGVVSTVRDPWGREGVDDVMPGAWRVALHPVGRLDQDTSGLLLFCSDGSLTQHLLHPKRAVPRSYVATVAIDPPSNLTERLAEGVETAEGVVCGVVEQVQGREVTLTVTEGKHRMVRRMLHNAGASVVQLHRVAYGPVRLDALQPREVRVVDVSLVRDWLAQHPGASPG